MLKNKSTVYLIGVILVVAIICFLALKKCGRGTDNIISEDGKVTTPVTVIQIDSNTIKEQQAVIVQSKQVIAGLEDSLEKLAIQKTGISPTYIVRYKDTFKIKETIPFNIDSLKNRLTDSLSSLYPVLKDRILVVPQPLLKSTKYYKLVGIVTNKGVTIDSLQVFNSTSVIFGETGKWYQRKTVKTNVVQDNPYLNKSGSSMQSFYYKPKDPKFSIVVGPTVLFDGHLRYGAGLTFGYKLY